MATNLDLDPLTHFPSLKGGPIPCVGPADVKSVWAIQEELKKRHAPNESFQVDMDYYRRGCSPGADVGSVWYRLAMFQLLQMTSESVGPSLPGLTDGKPGDAVFKALATLPMNGMKLGVVRDDLPFDVDEL